VMNLAYDSEFLDVISRVGKSGAFSNARFQARLRRGQSFKSFYGRLNARPLQESLNNLYTLSSLELDVSSAWPSQAIIGGDAGVEGINISGTTLTDLPTRCRWNRLT